MVAPVLVSDEPQHPALFHGPGAAQDLVGAPGEDFLSHAPAQLIEKIAVHRIGLGLFHCTEGKAVEGQGRSQPFPVVHVAGQHHHAPLFGQGFPEDIRPVEAYQAPDVVLVQSGHVEDFHGCHPQVQEQPVDNLPGIPGRDPHPFLDGLFRPDPLFFGNMPV